MAQCAYRALLEMDHVIHTGGLGVCPGGLYDISVNVISLDICLDMVIQKIIGFIHSLIPALALDYIFPVLRQK